MQRQYLSLNIKLIFDDPYRTEPWTWKFLRIQARKTGSKNQFYRPPFYALSETAAKRTRSVSICLRLRHKDNKFKKKTRSKLNLTILERKFINNISSKQNTQQKKVKYLITVLKKLLSFPSNRRILLSSVKSIPFSRSNSRAKRRVSREGFFKKTFSPNELIN